MKRTLPLLLGGTVTAILTLLLGRTYVIPALSSRPLKLGVSGGKLSPCDGSGCISSQSDDPRSALQPIPYRTDLDIARNRLISMLRQTDGVAIIDLSRPNYLYAEARSPLWQWIDDLEFYFDDENKLIQFRAAPRLRFSASLNRQRIQAISQQFQQH
jgi:uncharacterized protein (DUF1499 family)